MCRLAAYVGPEISLGDFLLKPTHGLMQQSWQPREMNDARLNADGYGFAWFAADNIPARFTNFMPIWSDTNLEALGRSLFSDLWLASVRSATPGLMTTQANTQPFIDEQLLFLHNGRISDFGARVRPRLRQLLAPEIEATVQGNTDSEYLFALLRHILTQDADLPIDESLIELLNILEDLLGEQTALLNIIVADGERIYALRHAIRDECPSLYFTTDDDDYPEGLLVASEPLTESKFWQAVPPHHILILDPEEPAQLLSL